MEYNNIDISIVGMAVSGQTEAELKVTYYYSDGKNKNNINVLPFKDTFKSISTRQESR